MVITTEALRRYQQGLSSKRVVVKPTDKAKNFACILPTFQGVFLFVRCIYVNDGTVMSHVVSISARNI